MSASEAKAAIFGYRCDVVEGPKAVIDVGSAPKADELVTD
jgi:hypothetical protein